MAVHETRKKRYKKVPPDGGYGYWVLVASSVNLISTTMFYVCFGMIYKDFFIKLGIGTTGISVLTGIRAVVMSLSTFMTGPLLKMTSRRKMAFLGATFYNSGMFGTVFVNTQAMFIFCQGFLQVIGIGFLYTVSCVCVNDYFVNKRLLSTGIVQSMAAAAGMMAPMVVSWTMAEYGYQCTLIVISAVGMQSYVAAMLLQPVAWHMKKVEITDSEYKTLLEKDEDTPSQPYENDENARSSAFATMKNILDWEMVKKYGPTSCCLGAPAALFADIMFMFNLAQALYASDWNDSQVKWCFALLAFGDLATRVFLIIFSKWLKLLSNRFIYLIGLIIGTATRIAMLWISDYTGVLVCMGVMGISRCLIIVMLSLVVADQVKPEQFPSAFGLSMSIYGVVSISCGPIIGAIRDATNNYTIMFSILIAIFTVSTTAWAIEMFRDWKRHKQVKQRNN